MAYGGDVSVFVEDNKGDQGAPTAPGKAWWVSPDVDIPAHTGEARQGPNDVQIRVHVEDEPIVDEKIAVEVYVCQPGFVQSPVSGTKRIDPGNIQFRPAQVPGTEPVASIAGGTATFTWTPSNSPTVPDGPGHRCLVVRAFPVSVTPPTAPFDVANERHEAQHNIEILMTTKQQADMSKGGAGTRPDPRRRDQDTGLWWERLATMAAGGAGKRYVVWAFDPSPGEEIVGGLHDALGDAGFDRFSTDPPDQVTLEPVDAPGEEIYPSTLLGTPFAERSGLGQGLWAEDRLVGAASLELEPGTLAGVVLRFDHSNIDPRSALVLHGAQWSERGEPEGGMTIVATAAPD